MSKSEYDTQISNIESIGFKKINEIRDEYKRRHIIYQKDNFYVDLFAEENTLGEDGDMVFNMWTTFHSNEYLNGVRDKLHFNDICIPNSRDNIIPLSIYTLHLCFDKYCINNF